MDKFPRYKSLLNTFPDKETKDEFRSKYPKYANVTDLTLNKIIMKFSEMFVDGVIQSRSGVAFPEMMGAVFIGAYSTNKKIKSYSRYNNNKIVSFSNLDTDGKLMKILYCANSVKAPMRHYTCWTFKLGQTNRRKASKYFKENWKNYVEINGIKVKNLFRNSDEHVDKTYKIENMKSAYNELDL